jgi:hypothetical protein
MGLMTRTALAQTRCSPWSSRPASSPASTTSAYSNPARSRLDVAYELLFVGAIAVVGALAELRFISLLRCR